MRSNFACPEVLFTKEARALPINKSKIKNMTVLKKMMLAKKRANQTLTSRLRYLKVN
jgi:hypothetical protein